MKHRTDYSSYTDCQDDADAVKVNLRFVRTPEGLNILSSGVLTTISPWNQSTHFDVNDTSLMNCKFSDSGSTSGLTSSSTEKPAQSIGDVDQDKADSKESSGQGAPSETSEDD